MLGLWQYISIGAFLGGLLAGGYTMNWRCDAQKAAALEQAYMDMAASQREATQKAEELEAQLAALEKDNTGLKRRVYHETRNDNYRCTIPAHGVRLYRESLGYKSAPAS